jgi:pimeloyl-ACP methyl ester carboxylesterase
MTDVVFLPGIIAPVEVRYGPLLGHLPGVHATLKDLEVYASDRPPPRYSVQVEVDGIEAAVVHEGLERFHLYGHSGGAACALAYVATHPDRVLSLAVDEPASDFTQADQTDPYWKEIDAAQALPGPASVAAFLRLQVAPGVELPPPPAGQPPPWMAKRPAGIAAFATALRHHHADPVDYAAFDGPVLFTFGSLTHPRWRTMRDRLQRMFPDFTSEEFDGLHHLNTSHQAEPARTAALLTQLWDRAEGASS